MTSPKLELSLPIWRISHFLSTTVVTRALHRVVLEAPSVPFPKPALVMAKHVNAYDIPLVADTVWRLTGEPPYFEMGTFYGYKVLGPMSGFLRKLGGFPVMRPKDVLRLRRGEGMTRDQVSTMMRDVNDRAVAMRAEILRRGHVLSFFPEGTRSADEVLELRSRHEVEEALELVETEGIDIHVVPIFPCFGARPRFRIPWLVRTPVTVKVLDPIPLKGRTVDDVIAEVSALMKQHWRGADPTP